MARLGGRAATEWLRLEETGAKRRWAHRVVEWDGWEVEMEMGGGGGGGGGWEGEGGERRHGEREGGKGERDVSADGGRELGRRLEQWVREGANVASYHDGEDEDEDEVEDEG